MSDKRFVGAYFIGDEAVMCYEEREPDRQGKREDQVTYSYAVTATCFGVLVVLLIGWGLLAWNTR